METQPGFMTTIILQILPLTVVTIALVIPAAKVLRRTGHSPWWALLAPVPLANIVALWWFAYKRWPSGPSDLSRVN
jgi:uncharacterized membrane protein YhaH (DUF805 family)